jgi:biotin carboxyl carrier protein
MPEYFVMEGDDERTYEVETIGDERYRVVTPEGEAFEVEAFEAENGRIHILRGHESHDVDVRETDEAFDVALRGHRHTFDVLNERERRMRKAGVGARGAEGPDLVSPMAGTIVEVSADRDSEVDQGETVVIIEAMKMENDLQAHKAGVLSEIHVEPGDSVEIGDELVSIES